MAHISFGDDGWRARVDDGYDEETLARAASAAGRYWADTFPGASVYIAYDTREGARESAELAAAIIASCGLHVVLSSCAVPAPVLSWTIAKNVFTCGGLMITGGRSGANTLGIKLRDQDGAPDTGILSKRIAKRLSYASISDRGPYQTEDLLEPYAQAIRSEVDTQLIASKRPRIVIDALYGACQGRAAQILQSLGAEVHELHQEPDSSFAGLVPDLSRGSSAFAALAMERTGAQAAFVFDGDGDGLAAIGARGALITTNQIIPILTDYLVRERGLRGGVVTSSAGSVLIKRQAKRLGLPFTLVPTGFRWLYNEMTREDVLIAGNETGAISIPSHLKERDPLYAIALLVEEMARYDCDFPSLVAKLEDEVGTMSFGRTDVPLDAVSIGMLSNLLPGINPQEVIGQVPALVDHADGLRVVLEDEAWVLVRPSGHDLLMRVYAEAPSIVERDALLEWGCSLTHTYI